MKEINCNIIRDLLPLYEDGAVSEDTAQLVREHLEGCPACREEYERMRTPTPVPPDRDISMILQMEDEMRKKSIRRFFCGVGVFVVLACLFCLWYTWPVPYEDLVPRGRNARRSPSMPAPSWGKKMSSLRIIMQLLPRRIQSSASCSP